MLVCETSVRLITGQDQASRIDLADTVERAWWTGETLQVQDARGTVTAMTVAGTGCLWYLARFPPDAHPQ